MPILVKCDCGAKYRVKDELAGRAIRCKKCEARISIESPNDNDDIMDAIEVSPPAAVTRDRRPERDAESQPAYESSEDDNGRDDVDDDDDELMRQELQRAQSGSSSAASNPGMMKVSYWRHFLAYPKWAVIWHLLLVCSIGLVFVSWFCFPLVLLFLWATRMYWNRVKTQFIAGCVNPAMILSVSPPLIAVHTNLTQDGSDEWNVVKVMAAPIHRMISGVPVQGDRLATVSFYESMSDKADHWTDFQPKPAACVASNPDDPQRILHGIEKDDWREFKDDLRQVPKPYTPGLYRTYAEETLNRQFTLDADDIITLIESEMSGINYCLLMSEQETIPHEINVYVPAKARGDVIAVIESTAATADMSQGLSLTHIGAFYNFNDVGKGVFRWENVVGGFATRGGLEITMTDGKRLQFSDTHFRSGMKYALETVIATIGRG